MPLLQLGNLGKKTAQQPAATPLQATTAPAAPLPPLELDWPGLSDESETDAGGGTPMQGSVAAGGAGGHEVVDLADLGGLRL